MTNLEMLRAVALALGDLRDEVVFVGGATVALYLQDPAAPEVRPTDDVDCIIELASYGGYAALEAKLRSRGFVNDSSPGAPICRWMMRSIKVDVMPTDERVLGFTNRWYRPGIRHKTLAQLPGETQIYVLPAPFFIGTKLEAFLDPRRGMREFRYSHDLEDVIAILDGRPSLKEEIAAAPLEIRQYLQRLLGELLDEPGFLEAIEGFLPAATEGAGRQKRLLGLVRTIVSCGNP